MTAFEQKQAQVAPFPLVGPGTSDVAGLVAVVRRLAIAHSLPEIMEVTTKAARTLLQADGVTFVLREGDLCYYAEEDAVSPLWKSRRFPMNTCISGWCMTEGKAAVIPDIYKDPRIPHDAYRPTFVRSLAMVPVRQEAPIAAMGAYWSKTGNTTPAQLELLQTIANSAALAVAFVELQQERHRAKKAASAAGLSTRGIFPSLHDLLAGRELPRVTRAALPAEASRASRMELDGSEPAASSGAGSGRGSKPWLRHGLLPHSPAAYAFAVGCVGVATLVRIALGSWIVEDATPFATYYPAVLFAALVGGASSGVLAIVLGALCAWWAFVPPYYSFGVPTLSDAVSLGLYLFASALIVWTANGYRRRSISLLAQEPKRLLLARELQHRMRNTLAVVQAIVAQSLRENPEQIQKINRRIAIVAASSNLLGPLESQPTDLKSILLAELEPYPSTRIVTQGEDLELEPEVARALALTFHELATNAAKYGSLSVLNGGLCVSWTIVPGRLDIEWLEQDGPPVVAPAKYGFGTHFTERLLGSVGGRIEIDFRSDGLACQIFVALPSSARRRQLPGSSPR
jgi:two-component sensor histidine kinase